MLNQIIQKLSGDQYVTIFVGLISILGILVGWSLNEISSHFGNRRKGKDAIGVALSIMISIWGRYLRSEDVYEAISKKYDLTDEQKKNFKISMVKNLNFERLIKLEADFNQAIKKISSTDPYLGQKLISRMFFEETIEGMLEKAKENTQVESIWNETAFDLLKIIRIQAEKTINELAWNHGFFTYFKFKKILKKPLEITAEMDTWMKKILNSGQAS